MALAARSRSKAVRHLLSSTRGPGSGVHDDGRSYDRARERAAAPLRRRGDEAVAVTAQAVLQPA